MAEDVSARVRLALAQAGIVPDAGPCAPPAAPGAGALSGVPDEAGSGGAARTDTRGPLFGHDMSSAARAAGGADAAAAWAGVLEVAARELATVSAASDAWSDPARTLVVDAMDRTTRVLGAAKAPLLVAQERSGTWRRPGVRSFEAHRAAKNREDMGAARRETTTARTLSELDGGLEALARGEITASHAQRLRAVADKVDPRVRAELLTGEGAAMVRDLAREHAPKVFERKVEELAATAHPATVQDVQEAIRARRYLRIMPGPGGTRVEGLLDPVAGHRFQLAIDAATPRPGKDDHRTLGQRNADALETISAAILAEGQLSPAPHVPTQVLITMTQDAFLAARAHLTAATHTSPQDAPTQGTPTQVASNDVAPIEVASSDAAAGEHTAVVDDVMPFPSIRAQDGPLLPPADLGKLLCGSAVGRLVVDADAVPMNVARTQRTFKGPQRRTVELRDQHCAWPDCGQIARFCDVHHLDHWVADHGETDVHRAVLVCAFHHHELHTHDLDLVQVPPPDTGPRPVRLPGDPDYEPPVYTLVPRSQTAHDRRTRLARRLRQDAQEPHAQDSCAQDARTHDGQDDAEGRAGPGRRSA